MAGKHLPGDEHDSRRKGSAVLRAADLRCSVRRWGWTCPVVMLGGAAGILMLWGFSVWTAVLVAVLLVCPAIMVWGAIHVRRRSTEISLEPVPETRGMSLNWAAPFYDR